MLHKLSVEGMPVNVIRTKHNKTTVDIIQEKKNSVYSQNQKGKKEKEKKKDAHIHQRNARSFPKRARNRARLEK